MTEVWICGYQSLRSIIPNLVSIDQVVDSQEKADNWKEDALHHKGADLRFWAPITMKMPVR